MVVCWWVGYYRQTKINSCIEKVAQKVYDNLKNSLWELSFVELFNTTSMCQILSQISRFF